ncbi:MAG: hypothetical protein CMG00_05285 [Candidatus Marinimicrobia bacterium]|nr:hypothetical protein [Candidatus Neomarinimicrobiota bacterium]|tara:strand:- start:3698 stop:4792 length:1095 start_codon:yes stop_codon:yes gene_type:complete
MSKSYTPGLKILKNTKIKKERKLPLKGGINCKIGDFVENSKIVASTYLPGNIHMLNIASQLNIDAQSIKEYLTVKIDQEINKGDVIAENNGLFGFFKTQVKSPIDGKISNVSITTGQIMISEPEVSVDIDAYINGEVVEIIKDEGVVIQSRGSLIQGIIGVGSEKNGELIFLDENPKDYKDKILVFRDSINKSQYDIYSEKGVVGIVAGGFDYQSLSDILGYRLGVAITGTESIPTTLMITEGFGDVQMSDKTYNLLKGHIGKNASINGATQIRAGVIRPEVIVTDINQSPVLQEFKEEDLIISEGSKVRVIRSPYFGKIGVVKQLPSEPVKIDSETKARVAKIEFKNNERKLVPRANLEIILE